MYVTNITNQYENITSSSYTDCDNITVTFYDNCTNNENIDNQFFKFSLLIIPSSILIFSLISLMIYTLIKPLLKNK